MIIDKSAVATSNQQQDAAILVQFIKTYLSTFKTCFAASSQLQAYFAGVTKKDCKYSKLLSNHLKPLLVHELSTVTETEVQAFGFITHTGRMKRINSVIARVAEGDSSEIPIPLSLCKLDRKHLPSLWWYEESRRTMTVKLSKKKRAAAFTEDSPLGSVMKNWASYRLTKTVPKKKKKRKAITSSSSSSSSSNSSSSVIKTTQKKQKKEFQ